MANRFDLVNLSNILQTSANGTVANVNFDSNTLFIDGVTNRVGIGTSSPITQLAVVGGAMQFSPGTSAEEGVRIQRAAGVCTFSGINNDNNTYNGLAFFTGASEAMRIDTSGRVTKPFTPAFSVNSRQISGYFNNVTVIYKNVVQNNGGHYSTTTGRFTAPVAGYYFFIANGIINNASGNTNGQLSIRVNDVTKQSNYVDVITTAFIPTTIAAIVYLNVNDYVTVYASAGLAGWFDNGSSVVEYNNFSGLLIG